MTTVKIEYTEGDKDDHFVGSAEFVRHVRPGEVGLCHLTEPHIIAKTSPDDVGSVFPLRCVKMMYL